MNAHSLKGCLTGLLALAFCHSVSADVITVAPGFGTLETAVAAATSGDVLELIDGTYGGPGFTIGKSLTVRAQTSSDVPVVSLSGPLYLGGVGTVHTWQRVTFDGMYVYTDGSGSTVTIQNSTFNSVPQFGVPGGNKPAVVRVIESTFVDTGFGNCSASNCGPIWTVIGNTFILTAATPMAVNTTNEVHVFGNRFDFSVPQDLEVSATNSVHFIGNDLATSETSANVVRLLTPSGIGTVHFVGNRLDARFDTSFGDTVVRPVLARIETCKLAQVRNNLFRVIDTSALSTTSGGSRVSGVIGVDLAGCGSANEVSNNVFDYGNFNLGIETSADNGVVHLSSAATVQTNIFTGITKPHFTFAAATVTSNLFRNNLCFQTVNSCTNQDGNQDADPLFVDQVDYMLGGGSPAIDAGPDSPFVIDTDGSVADLGLYGGQFPIDQFDIQRTPGRTAPFVYPLFNATQDVDTLGNVQIKVIGAARLR